MNKVLFSISFLMLGLISCQNNQKQQPSEAEIEQMVKERVEAEIVKMAQDHGTENVSQHTQNSQDQNEDI